MIVDSVCYDQKCPLRLSDDVQFTRGLAKWCEEPQSGLASRSDTVHVLITLHLL